MSGLPNPLVAAEVDLTDFAYMPLSIARLKQSRAWLTCKRRPELAFYMINLWTASWHSRPAGSLEIDDEVLADIAMCTDEVWLRIKSDVLRGWVECSDGRLYHPVVAEQAMASWAKKTAQRQRTAAARAAKEALNAARGNPSGGTTNGSSPPTLRELVTEDIEHDVATSVTAAVTEPVTFSVTEPVTGSKGSKGKGRKEKKDPPSQPKPARAKHDYPADFEGFWGQYPTTPNMGKLEAYQVWAKLDGEDRAAAMAGLPGFRAFCRKDTTYKPIYADRWLSKRRFEGYAPNGPGQGGTAPIIDFGGGYTAPETVVVDMIRKGHWAPHWGPKVGEPGCKVPQRLLDEAAH